MIVFFAGLWISVLIFYLFTKKYKSKEKFESDSSKNTLAAFYPCAFFLMDYLPMEKIFQVSAKTEAAMERLYGRSEYKARKTEYQAKRIVIVMISLFMIGFLGFLAEVLSGQKLDLFDGFFVKRPEGQVDRQVTLQVESTGEDKTAEEEISVTVRPQQPEQNQMVDPKDQEMYKQAYEYIDEVILKENTDISSVYTDLCLPVQILDTSIRVVWSMEPSNVIDSDGELHSQDLKQPVQIFLKGDIQKADGKSIGLYQVNVTVMPYADYLRQKWKDQIEDAVNQAEQSSIHEKVVTLPEEIGGKKLAWSQKKESVAAAIVLLGFVTMILLYIMLDEKLQTQLKTRKKQMLLDYPEIVNKLALLIGAGMTISGAWDRITCDYLQLVEEQLDQGSELRMPKRKEKVQKRQQKKKENLKRYAYEEMLVTNQEFKLGVTEAKCIEDFGRRAGAVEYLKLSGILIQNLKKGTEGLTHVLELMADEAFENRKHLAKQLGEEAGTKLLLPMGVMLLLVLAIVMIPAFWSMKM